MPYQLENSVPANPGARLTADVLPVSSDYFHTLRVPVLLGRAFTNIDSASAPALVNQNVVRTIVVNQTFARRFFGTEDPIGRYILVGEPTPRRMEVVGMVGDTLQSSLTAPAPALIYMPFGRSPFWFATLIARTKGNAESVLELMRREVATIAPGVPLIETGPLETFVDKSFAASARRAQLLSAISGAALLLAAVSLYGILAYMVAGRTHEIGVRLALGAEPRRVMWLVLRRGLVLVSIGSAIGLALSAVITRFLRNLLFGVHTLDASTLASVLVIVGLVTTLACWLPARRATRVDPMVVLRNE
jgi:putative ABC transport system permease protein